MYTIILQYWYKRLLCFLVLLLDSLEVIALLDIQSRGSVLLLCQQQLDELSLGVGRNTHKRTLAWDAATVCLYIYIYTYLDWKTAPEH